VLLTDSLHLVRGRRVGLVTNQAGVDAAGTPDLERLREAGIQLVALFSPEHGFRGTQAPGAEVPFSTDSATGLPIYSLYGRTSAPTPEMFRGLDVILVDLQDSGARYFTYLWTTVQVLQAAASAGVHAVVLDRPNPIGSLTQGNLTQPENRSPVGYLIEPMRHGLTIGELSRLAVVQGLTVADFTVVPVSGWRREMTWEQTGLPFVPPSPNLRSPESLFHYPGLCLFEGTAISVGRGSDAPFEQIGAPWLDTAEVLRRMRRAGPPGVSMRAVTFTPLRPGDGKFADTLVTGIRLSVTDPQTYDPTATAVNLLAIIQELRPDRIGWDSTRFDRLAGGSSLRQALQAGESPAAIVAGWQDGLRRFQEMRRAALLYPP
jgi:uncharacterized protein YbbC (DUF1343 family)